MQRILLGLTLMGVIVALGCGTTGVSSTFTSDETPITQYTSPPSGFTAKRIAVLLFKDKTKNSPLKGDVGNMAIDQMITLLVNSDRFQVIERERLEDLLKEQNLAKEGIVDTATAARIGKVLGAELIFTGSITNWEVKTTKTGTWFVVAGTKKREVTIDLAVDGRIIDATTSAIVAADSGEIKRVEKVSSTAILGIGPKGYIKLDESVAGKQLRLALDQMLKKMIPRIDRKFSKE